MAGGGGGGGGGIFGHLPGGISETDVSHHGGPSRSACSVELSVVHCLDA